MCNKIFRWRHLIGYFADMASFFCMAHPSLYVKENEIIPPPFEGHNIPLRHRIKPDNL